MRVEIQERVEAEGKLRIEQEGEARSTLRQGERWPHVFGQEWNLVVRAVVITGYDDYLRSSFRDLNP
jgi:hypothetical protein